METERLQQLELLDSPSPSSMLESGSEPDSESSSRHDSTSSDECAMDDPTVTVNDTIGTDTVDGVKTSTIETQDTNFAVEPALDEIETNDKKLLVKSTKPAIEEENHSDSKSKTYKLGPLNKPLVNLVHI